MIQTKKIDLLKFPYIENSNKKQFPSLISVALFICLSTSTIFIIFSDFLMFYEILLSLQVKRSATISNKHGI